MVQEALRRLPPNNYEAAELLGVSEATIRNWRAGDVPAQLRADTRNAVERYLAGELDHVRDDGIPDSLPQDVLRDLWRRLDAIDGNPEWSEREKLLRREHELAALRGSTQDRESRVAELRTMAIAQEVELARDRATHWQERPRRAQMTRAEKIGGLGEVAPISPGAGAAGKGRRRQARG